MSGAITGSVYSRRIPTGRTAHLSHGFFAADRVYKRNATLPLNDEDLASPDWVSGDGTCRYSYTDHGAWTFDEPDVSGELALHDFHPAVDIYPKSGQVGQRIASGHLEAGCRVTGRVRIGDAEFDVDAMGIRDRGWGVRYWEEILVHRWAVATFGPHETVYAVSILGSHGQVHDFGALVRGTELIPATEVDVVTFLERDGLTHRGGTARMVLATGEVVDLRAEPLQKGIISFMAGKSAINDTICRFTWGDRAGSATSRSATTPRPGSRSRCSRSMGCSWTDFTSWQGSRERGRPGWTPPPGPAGDARRGCPLPRAADGRAATP